MKKAMLDELLIKLSIKSKIILKQLRMNQVDSQILKCVKYNIECIYLN